MIPLVLLASACVLVLIGYLAVYRSVLWTALGLLLATLFGVGSYAVLVVGELTGLVDYVGEPDAPLLLVLARDGDPWAATPVEVGTLVETWVLLQDAQSDDEETSTRALETLERSYRDRLPANASPREEMKALSEAVIADVLPGLRGDEAARVLGRVRAGAWGELEASYSRVVIVDTARVRERVAGLETLEYRTGGAGEEIVVDVNVEALLECLDALDCGARLRAGIDRPSLLLSRINDLTGPEVDDLYDLYHDIGELFDGVRTAIPEHAGANVAVAGFLLREAGPEDPGERAAFFVEAVRDGVLRVEPPTVLTTTANLALRLPLDSML